MRRWLESWPVPFKSRDDAVAFFGGKPHWARTWADGLEVRDDGLWPRFDIETMVASLEEAAEQSYWDEWERIRCPVLITYPANAAPSRATLERMADPSRTTFVGVANAGHDLHLDNPGEWRRSVSEFLAEHNL